MTSARSARLTQLRQSLLREQLDGLLISSLPNVRYLTGFSGSNALLLLTQGDALLLTDPRYEVQVSHEVAPGIAVHVQPSSLWKGLWTLLGGRGLKVLGFESVHLAHRDFQRLLEQGSDWHWRPVRDLVEQLRMVKDEAEVSAIRQAGRVATFALEALLPRLGAGPTELEVCGWLEQLLREGGSEAHPFPPIVASGPRSALPHARASSRRVARGDFLLLDFGATVDGYCSDITRTLVIGSPDQRQRDAYEAVQGAHAAAVAGIRAGMTGVAADALARDFLQHAGFGDAFSHSLGHGLGLEVHEAPRLSKSAEDSLPERSVVTIEPGVYVDGWGGVRLEDDVYVTREGVELLTHFPLDLGVVGA